jgi:hypothetical protein
MNEMKDETGNLRSPENLNTETGNSSEIVLSFLSYHSQFKSASIASMNASIAKAIIEPLNVPKERVITNVQKNDMISMLQFQFVSCNNKEAASMLPGSNSCAEGILKCTVCRYDEQVL